MSCRDCKYVHVGNFLDPHGACRRFPPEPLSPTESTFPIVHLDKFACGEFERRLPAKKPERKAK